MLFHSLVLVEPLGDALPDTDTTMVHNYQLAYTTLSTRAWSLMTLMQCYAVRAFGV